MKIRNGFVSNSSSSSFIVKFPRAPKNVEEVKRFLFKGKDKFYSSYYDEFWSTDEVSEIVFNDIISQEPSNINDAIEEVKNGYLEDSPNYDHYVSDYKDRNQLEKYYKAIDEYAEKKVKDFFNERLLKLDKIEGREVKDEVFYIFEYSDNDGSLSCAMEHGDLFDNLEHIKISKH